ncbi:MAG: hypothetical protein HC849_01715 [Oscillatoriales cyanobacterium RU_3_3]|nr:hypothetical protein [Oscillatoriales cyanobacterium RU_3_3]
MAKINLQGGFDELAFLEFFCEEPKKSQPSDGYWCYEVTDSLGVTIVFGMNIIQESVQIELKIAEATVGIMCFERVKFIEITDYINGKLEFLVAPENDEFKTLVQVELRPRIKVDLSTLSLCPLVA